MILSDSAIAGAIQRKEIVIEPFDMECLGSNSYDCLLYTSPSPRDLSTSRMPSSA